MRGSHACARLAYTPGMDAEDLRECTLPGASPSWMALVSGVPGQPLGFELTSARTGLRHLAWAGGEALVAGQPRPEQAPAAAEADPDPAVALVHAYQTGGVSALRRVEGPWSLVYWDAREEELLLAVDRLGREGMALVRLGHGWQLGESVEALTAHFGLPAQHPSQSLVLVDPAVGRQGGVAAANLGADVVGWLAPGTHLRLRADGLQQAGVHGAWRLEKRERRPAVLVAGEFIERLKSVLRLALEQADVLLLAEHPVEGALVAACLAQLAGPQPAVLYLPELAAGTREHWQEVCAHFKLRFLEPEPMPEPRAALRVVPRAPWSPARTLAERAALVDRFDPAGLARLAAVAGELGNWRTPADRPLCLLSARGFELALPRQSLPLISADAWRSLRDEPPPNVAGTGARLAEACSRCWQPALGAALRGSGVELGWPMLDETVSHFLANLPVSMLVGSPWSFDFRRRILRDLLPPHLRAAASQDDAASGSPNAHQ